MTIQDEQAPIFEEIVNLAISSTPEHWDTFTLYLEYVWGDDPEAIGTVQLSLHNGKEPCTPEDNLYDATFKLLKLFHRHGISWIGAQFEIGLNDEGNWKYKAEFQY